MTTANADAFEATDRNAASGVGEPSYTSGTHMCQGTTAILKAKPATMSVSASSTP